MGTGVSVVPREQKSLYAFNEVRNAVLGAAEACTAELLDITEEYWRRLRRKAELKEKIELPDNTIERFLLTAFRLSIFKFENESEWSITARTLRFALINCSSYEKLDRELMPLADELVKSYNDRHVFHVAAAARWALWLNSFRNGGRDATKAKEIEELWSAAAAMSKTDSSEQRVYSYNARSVRVHIEYIRNFNKHTPCVEWAEGYLKDAIRFGEFGMWRDAIEQFSILVTLDPKGAKWKDKLEAAILGARACIEGKSGISDDHVRDIVIPALEKVDCGEVVRSSKAFQQWKFDRSTRRHEGRSIQ